MARTPLRPSWPSICCPLFGCPDRGSVGCHHPPDAVLCADGPVKSLVGLSLVPESRRGHGALYDAVNGGGIVAARLRAALANVALPGCAARLVPGWPYSGSCAR
jgi:hypothetical protein